METEKQKTNFIGLEELNESVKKEVSGGVIPWQDILTPCCGFVINSDPDFPGGLKPWWPMV